MIINERVINIPQETAPPLVDGLFDEIGWATEDEPTKELRDSFKFSKYLFFTRLFRDDDPEQNEQNKKRKRSDEPLLVYIRPEDEFSISWQSGLSHGRRKAPRIRMTLTI